VMTERLLGVVAAQTAQANRPVHLVGHSLGGLLARAVAIRAPEQVASVAMLGSPFRGLRVHPLIRATAGVVKAVTHARRGVSVRARCLTLACDCMSVCALHQRVPADIPQLAVVTRYDGLADWRYCMDPPRPPWWRLWALTWGWCGAPPRIARSPNTYAAPTCAPARLMASEPVEDGRDHSSLPRSRTGITGPRPQGTRAIIATC
jgi:pimeloyl-ACP methyl ester carboxylesterase